MELNNSTQAAGRQEASQMGAGDIPNGTATLAVAVAGAAASGGAAAVGAAVSGGTVGNAVAFGASGGAAGVGAAASGAGVGDGAAGGIAAAGGVGAGPRVRVRRRGNHRHSKQQINALQAYFKNNEYPSKEEREELARNLGMDPPQVKFWFQNKRKHKKRQTTSEENSAMRSENDGLGARRQQVMEDLSRAYANARRAMQQREDQALPWSSGPNMFG